jgi:cell wall-associated NlpC family hydrolase
MSVGTGTAALSLGLCLCAGQLISTSAAVAATPVVTAATAAAKAKPTVRASANVKSVTLGGKVRLTTKVIDPKTGKVVRSGTVRLQAYRKGAWRTWTTRKIYTSGTASVWEKPGVTGSFRFQYLGNSHFTAANSGGVKVTVKPAANKGAKVLAEAKRHTGALYKFAAAGPSRFDCSGFTMYVYRKAVGKKLPHKANSQQNYGKAVSKGSKKVGDLIIFRSGSYGYHAAIYAGSGYMYDSPHTGARVGKHKIYGSNYVVRRMA